MDELLPGLMDEYPLPWVTHKEKIEAGGHHNGRLGRREMWQLCRDIAQTFRPTWQQPPPLNIGLKTHGKLKADQWRTCIEFDLPVSLVRLWASNGIKPVELDTDRRMKVVESTMLLATAIRWATSHQTSQRHADEYMCNMRGYLASLRELFPEVNLLPNHHNALYLGEMLLRMGPVRGWWMFPFERVIGLLQNINTNGKIGKILTYHYFIFQQMTLTVYRAI